MRNYHSFFILTNLVDKEILHIIALTKNPWLLVSLHTYSYALWLFTYLLLRVFALVLFHTAFLWRLKFGWHITNWRNLNHSKRRIWTTAIYMHNPQAKLGVNYFHLIQISFSFPCWFLFPQAQLLIMTFWLKSLDIYFLWYWTS